MVARVIWLEIMWTFAQKARTALEIHIRSMPALSNKRAGPCSHMGHSSGKAVPLLMLAEG